MVKNIIKAGILLFILSLNFCVCSQSTYLYELCSIKETNGFYYLKYDINNDIRDVTIKIVNERNEGVRTKIAFYSYRKDTSFFRTDSTGVLKIPIDEFLDNYDRFFIKPVGDMYSGIISNYIAGYQKGKNLSEITVVLGNTAIERFYLESKNKIDIKKIIEIRKQLFFNLPPEVEEDVIFKAIIEI